MAEWSIVIPFVVYISAILLGADGDKLRVPFLLCLLVGILLYMAEIRRRFKYRHGRRP